SSEISSDEPRQTSSAVPDMIQMNVIKVEDAQQHIRVPLHVIGEHDVTVPLEFAVDSTDKLDGYFLVRVPVRIPHVGSLINKHVIENVAVAVRDVPQSLAEVRQVLHVIAIDLRVVGFVR